MTSMASEGQALPARWYTAGMIGGGAGRRIPVSLSAEADRSFGVLLRDHRLAAGLTQEALAEQATVAPRSIQALERGTSRPHRETAERLAGALRLAGTDRTRFLAAGPPVPRRRVALGATARPDPAPLVGRVRDIALLD